MSGKEDPKWIRLSPGQEIEVEFLQESGKRELNHWVQNQARACMGPDCHLCAARIPTRERYLIDVKVDGETQVLTLPGVAWGDMLAILSRPESLVGYRVAIAASGSGVNRRHMFRALPPEYSIGPQTENGDMPLTEDMIAEVKTMLAVLERFRGKLAWYLESLE